MNPDIRSQIEIVRMIGLHWAGSRTPHVFWGPKTKGTEMARELTVVQLENILQKRKLKLEQLQKKRDRLRKKLADLERQIAEIGGAHERRPRKRRRRPKNPKTLLAAVIETLAQHKQGLILKDLAKKILASGYKTSSKNFQNTLYQILYHNSDQLVHDPKTHAYGLKQLPKKASPIGQPAVARKSRPSVTAGKRRQTWGSG